MHDVFASSDPMSGFGIEQRCQQHGQAKQAKKEVIKQYLQRQDLYVGKGNVIGPNAPLFH